MIDNVALIGLPLAALRKFDLADFLDPLLESETVERFDSQARENLDAIFQLAIDTEKEATLLIVGADEGRRIGDSPVRGDWLARPKWALLGSGLIADGENEVERNAIRRGEFVPAFRPQAFRFVIQLFQQLERQWMDRALGMTPRAEGFELPLAPSIDGALRHYAARGISGAEKQDIVFAISHSKIVRRRLPRVIALSLRRSRHSLRTAPARSTKRPRAVSMRQDSARRRCRTRCSRPACETFPTICRSAQIPSLCCRARSSTPHSPASGQLTRGVEPSRDYREVFVRFDLQPKMIETRHLRSRGDRKIDRRIVEHPLRIVGFEHR